MRNKRDLVWLVVLIAAIGAAAYLFRSARHSEPSKVDVSPVAAPSTDLKLLQQPDAQEVVLLTHGGKIIFELYPNAAPHHVARIKDLVQRGYYNGLLFHRVIANFIIQFGDPNTRSNNRSTWGMGRGDLPPLAAEFNALPHVPGTVAMAKTFDRDSATTQFYICVGKPSPFLDGKYTVFGHVVQGQDIAEAISRVARDPRDIPLTNEAVDKAYLISHP